MIFKLLCTIHWKLFDPCFTFLFLVHCRLMPAAFITNQTDIMVFFALDYRKELIISDSVWELFWHFSNNLKIASIVKFEKCITCKRSCWEIFKKCSLNCHTQFHNSQNLLHGLNFEVLTIFTLQQQVLNSHNSKICRMKRMWWQIKNKNVGWTLWWMPDGIFVWEV